MLKIKQVWEVGKQSVTDFIADDAMSWAAAVAFYTALSFAPIVMIMVSIADWLGHDTREHMIGEARAVMGDEATGVIDTVVENANQSPGGGVLPFIIGLGVTLFSASAVFGQLQLALNRIWEVKVPSGQGIWTWLRKRLLSMGMVAVLAFMVLVSVAASAVLGHVLPRQAGLGRVATVGVSLVVLVPLFMVMFKLLPDARIAWRDVLFGAVATTVLFVIGREGIGLYLNYAAVGSAYGAAGSLVVLLVWVYYSAIIVLLGAELTQSRAKLMGRSIEPEAHAIRDEAAGVTREQRGGTSGAAK